MNLQNNMRVLSLSYAVTVKKNYATDIPALRRQTDLDEMAAAGFQLCNDMFRKISIQFTFLIFRVGIGAAEYRLPAKLFCESAKFNARHLRLNEKYSLQCFSGSVCLFPSSTMGQSLHESDKVYGKGFSERETSWVL